MIPLERRRLHTRVGFCFVMLFSETRALSQPRLSPSHKLKSRELLRSAESSKLCISCGASCRIGNETGILMTESSMQLRARWCIVVADDHGPQGAPVVGAARPSRPVQYCRIGESATLLHKALRRAARIAPTCQLMVTALEDFREQWEPALWFVRPENRFVCDHPSASLLTTAAALLSIAAKSPSHVVTVLPARCYVAQEWILGAALDHALR